jgi:TonB family protein
MQAVTPDKDEKKSKVAGYVGTGIVHVAIFAVLWFVTIGMADPPLDGTAGGGGGISISLGEPDAGGDSDVPVAESQPIQQVTPPQPETESPVVVDETETAADAVVTQPAEKPKVETKKTPEKKPDVKPVETKKEPVEKPREADKRSLFQKKTGATGDGTGYGSGDKPGNQGAEDGSLDGSPNGYGSGGEGNGTGGGIGDGIGPGSGNGISFDLKGRSLQRKPVIEDKSKETGKVVVSIVVDRNGKVTKAMPNQRGTTNPKLAEVAKQAALDMKFSPKPDAPEEQFGTVTIEFKFRP